MVNFDKFGPEKIFEVWDAKTRMHGFVVIDNTVLGPGKGGIRMTKSVSVEEVYKLARTMTWKNALAELPFGGAKSGIIADARNLSEGEKKAIVESFSRAIKPVCPELYVAAPDMNMGETEMEWFAKANGDLKSCTGKPANLGGLPHELGSTGLGVFYAAKIGAQHIGLKLKNAKVAVEGFGNVGVFASKFLAEAGAKLVAVSDSKGCVYNPEGFDFDKLSKIKKETGSVINYKPGNIYPNKKILALPIDLLITAAVPDLIAPQDVDNIRAKLIVEGSNIPAKPEVEEMLHKKHVLVIPDFVANAGGVISSYVEYIGGDKKKMFELVKNKITRNVQIVLKSAEEERIKPRDAALKIAQERILSKMG